VIASVQRAERRKPCSSRTGRELASGSMRPMKTINWESIASRFSADPVLLALCVSTVIFALVGLFLVLSES
jgi:hypothetical protein